MAIERHGRDAYPVGTPWAQSADETLAQQSVDSDRGLDPADVAHRLLQYGPNRLEEATRIAWWEILFRQVKSLIVVLLAVAAGVSFAFGEWIEGLAIGMVIIINAAIGLVTELRAVRSMEALQRLTRVASKVRRGGELLEIPAEGMVPGDIVVLDAGDLVSADLRLVNASKLQADESALTGESLPVSKGVDPLPSETPLADRTNMLFKGTMVTRGSGEAVVISTGMATELGEISLMIEAAEEEATPLEQRLERLGRMLLWVALVIAAAIAGIGIATGKEVLLMIETSIALAVAAIPEGLPIVATLALARGMWRMAQRNAVIRRLSAVETLGAASVICTDKTGTLTENRMAVARFALASGEIEVSDHGFVRDGRPIEASGLAPLRTALDVGVLCNNAEVQAEGVRGVGDPLEVALLRASQLGGIDPSELRKAYPEVREEAFDPESKRMATVQKRPEGGYIVTVKGAPESILEICTRFVTGDGVQALDDAARQDWMRAEQRMASEGLRVLGLATKQVDVADARAYEDLSLVGWVALADPPRGDVADAIGRCRRAGIDVVMVTGDQPATALSIARAVGLVDREGVQSVRGLQLDRIGELADDERRNLLHTRVFARVTPRQKLELISLFQGDGRVVAMTGDGVNDAPALKKADIGVAMGRRGTQVAQEAADMVLKDDAFGTIVEAVAQGRAIFDNIRKFVVYLLSCNVSEIVAVALASFAGLPLPLLPLQILFLNLVTDVFPALALGAGEGGPGIMRRSPRPFDEPIVTSREWVTIGGFGALIAAVVLGGMLLATHAFGLSEAQGTTTAFLMLAFAQLWHVFNMRDPASGFVRNDVTRNRYVWGALVLCSGLLIASVYLPALARVLKTVDPTPTGWLIVLAGSLIPWVVGQLALSLAALSNRSREA